MPPLEKEFGADVTPPRLPVLGAIGDEDGDGDEDEDEERAEIGARGGVNDDVATKLKNILESSKLLVGKKKLLRKGGNKNEFGTYELQKLQILVSNSIKS